MESVRVDTWLWTVRQLRSRSLATAAARAGHVRVNGRPAKASTPVRVGDEVRLRVQGFDRILEVRKLLSTRVGAPLAVEAYADQSPPRLPRELAPAPIIRDPGAGRPTKRERRQLDELRGRRSH
ncbi:RNA-binding S4 domain-containing protein [Naumannella sp. ID2617S]|uniref:RNA-binding protein S4 n=1 Tax=Enemella dayhoffiae TaxID=2016507 RepID=A0A255H5M1_9ACTN|nr:S4 domain-containing protein [Enemella dayhoffiae]NNG20738.1 RNA-binding S4 domain-containing protein [Naumannella sp. ID2617S]OYO22832.1 RNA-binding protein S4 [Enemella dayhoffiae]